MIYIWAVAVKESMRVVYVTILHSLAHLLHHKFYSPGVRLPVVAYAGAHNHHNCKSGAVGIILIHSSDEEGLCATHAQCTGDFFKTI